jgi:hypothetical protein
MIIIVVLILRVFLLGVIVGVRRSILVVHAALLLTGVSVKVLLFRPPSRPW